MMSRSKMPNVVVKIRFPKTILRALKRRAIQQHTSMAQLVRDAVARAYRGPGHSGA